jgi:uncharacterized protein
MHSCLYEGWVRHRRFAPTPHAFRYELFMAYLDLSEIDDLVREQRLLSTSRFAPVAFRRADYLGDRAASLDESVRACVEKHTGARPAGPIRVLTQLAHFGFCFNPVSFYYCFDARGEQVESILAQITNTPWAERHEYVLQRRQAGGQLRERFAKRFHVSPFMPMSMQYDWRFRVPDATLAAHMDVLGGERKSFDATLVLKRHAMTDVNLARMLLKHPLMSARSVGSIYWQALRLYLKGARFHPHPRSSPDRIPIDSTLR